MYIRIARVLEMTDFIRRVTCKCRHPCGNLVAIRPTRRDVSAGYLHLPTFLLVGSDDEKIIEDPTRKFLIILRNTDVHMQSPI